MIPAFHNSEPYLRGREAELRVAAWLQNRGFYILPSCDYSGPEGDHAPKIHGTKEGLILPDLAIAKKGRLKWAEVKAKYEPTYSRCTGTYDHGISRRLCNHYLRVQEETGAPVWVFIVEEKTQTLLFQSIDELRKAENIGHKYFGDVMDHGGMVFWPRTIFHPWILSEMLGLFDIDIPLAFEQPE